jgi:error-prone DNA polymerase
MLPDGKSIRLGMRLIKGLGEDQVALIVAARSKEDFLDLQDMIRRTGLRKPSVEALAEAGALEDLVPGRREALWEARAPRSGPLFHGTRSNEHKVALRPLGAAEQLLLDYSRTGLSINDHPMRHVRKRLASSVVSIANLAHERDGAQVEIAGVVLNRQQPYTASGVVFMTLEDETGMANLVLWAKVFEENRHTAVHARLLWVRGRLERKEGVTHIIVQSLARLDIPTSDDTDQYLSQIRPKSRDFC